MFWDASYTPSPKIEALLNKENVTLLELLDDEEIISECKSQNSKLVQFLNRPDILEELISLITTVPPPNVVEALRFKHSNIACEILTSDLQSINRSIVLESTVLQKLYAFLEQDAPLNPLLLSFFSKVFGMLWTQKQKQDWFTYQFVCVTVLEFLKSRGNFLDSILRHVYSPVILDLVYHMVTHIEGPDIRKTLYEWLMEQQLVEKLIGILGESDGEDAADKHLNVAQFVVEYLSMGRTKRQSEKQEGVTTDPILDLLEDKSTIQLLLDKMVAEDCSSPSSSAIVAGTRIILALFDDNLINDNTDDPALQYLVNSEKEHHGKVVANLIEVIKGYVNKFHDLLLIEPTPLISVVESGLWNETVVLSDKDQIGDESQGDSGKASASDGEKATEEKEDEAGECATQESSSTSDVSAEEEQEEEGKESVVAGKTEAAVESQVTRRNPVAQSPAFGNTRLQICCLFTVLLETENRDIINAICASNFFKTLLNLFKQYCWNNFLHSQVKKCLTYAIGAFDEVRVEAANEVQLEVSDLQRHLIVDCKLASVLVECWQANEREQVERNGVRLGYMGHLIGILDVLVTNCKVSEKLRALVGETLSNELPEDDPSGVCNADLWTRVTGEKGALETEMDSQNRFLADCNPCKMNDCEPKDFFIEATDTFQDLESTALSENLDNFLSRYISSDLNSHFFNTVNGWSEDNLDEFEGLADKNWSKFEGDGGESSGNPLSFAAACPWDNDEDDQAQPPDDMEPKSSSAAAAAGSDLTGPPSSDSGWANFSSANFADFDTHFNEFAIGTFDGLEVAALGGSKSKANTTADSLDEGAKGDVKSTSLIGDGTEARSTTADSNSDANTKKSDEPPAALNIAKAGSPMEGQQAAADTDDVEETRAGADVEQVESPAISEAAHILAEKLQNCSLLAGASNSSDDSVCAVASEGAEVEKESVEVGNVKGT